MDLAQVRGQPRARREIPRQNGIAQAFRHLVDQATPDDLKGRFVALRHSQKQPLRKTR